MDELPQVRTFTRTFRYQGHHIVETRDVEGRPGFEYRVRLEYVIDGWDRMENVHISYLHKYLDMVDERTSKAAIARIKAFAG
jgi:hypothetical protein